MNKLKWNQRTLSNSTRNVHAAIDQILSKGGDHLYDKYIQGKIPEYLGQSVDCSVRTLFVPFVSWQQQVNGDVENVHQSIISKIHLIKGSEKKQKKNKQKQINIVNNSKNTTFSKGNNSKGNNSKLQTNDRETQTVKRTDKMKDKSLPQHDKTVKLVITGRELSPKGEAVWSQREKRYKQAIIDQSNKEEQRCKNLKFRNKLEEQLKLLQDQNRPIIFDQQSGRLLTKTEQEHIQNTPNMITKSKKGMILLKYNFGDENQGAGATPTHRQISQVRKIMTFQRTKRSHQPQGIEDINDSIYNNNGSRQFSTIPLIQTEEGVNITEGNHIDKKVHSARVASATITHRSFKSYARSKLQSAGVFRTVATAQDNNRYERAVQSKQSKRSTLNTLRGSLLWSSRAPKSKSHRISQNKQLLWNCLDNSMELNE